MVSIVTPGVGLLLAAACQLTVDVTYGQTPNENISFTDGATSDRLRTHSLLNGDQKNDVTNSTPLMSDVESPEVGDDGFQPLSDFSKVLITIFYAIVTVVAVGGNATVCCIVATQRRMQTVTNFFIMSLACSDVLMASLCIPTNFVANVITHYWPFGVALCPIVTYAQGVTVFLSAFTMLAISIDRYRAVIFPLKPRLTVRVTAIIIAVTWALAMIASLPVAMYARVSSSQNHTGTPQELCVEDWPLGNSQRYVYSIVVMVLQYFLPLAILSFTYANIGVVIWVKKAPGEAENTRDQRLAASKRKMVKMMITVVVIYACCWLPLHTITLVGDAHPIIWTYRHIQLVWISCHWLAMSHCCYNPIVYCWMNAKFRAGFRHVFRFCPCIRAISPGTSTHSTGAPMTSYADMSSAVGGRRRFYSSATVSCSVVMTTRFDEHDQKSPLAARKLTSGGVTSAVGRAVGPSTNNECYALCEIEN